MKKTKISALEGYRLRIGCTQAQLACRIRVGERSIMVAEAPMPKREGLKTTSVIKICRCTGISADALYEREKKEKPDFKGTFLEKIRYLIDRTSKSESRLATSLGLGEKYFLDLRKRKAPYMHGILQICDHFGVSLDWLLNI